MTDLETAARAALEALRQARIDTETWAAYVDDYFRRRWDIKGDLARQDAAIAALEAALAKPGVDPLKLAEAAIRIRVKRHEAEPWAGSNTAEMKRKVRLREASECLAAIRALAEKAPP